MDTKITSVVVYPDRARVTRSGTETLEPGVHQLEIAGLPLKLNPDSLRAAAQGTAQARLLGVQARRAFFVDTPVVQVRDLETQLEALQDEMQTLDARIELVKQSRATLNSLAGHTEIFATALASGEMSVDAQLAIFDGLRARAEKLADELNQLSASRRELERRIHKVKNELDRWRGAPRRESYTAVVEVDVQSRGDLTVEASYVVSDARWQPLYDLRLLEVGANLPVLEVSYLGQVTQRTGENWEDVALTLSTARPALAGVLPELDPWFVQPLPPPRPLPAARFSEPQAAMMKSKADLRQRSAAAASDEAVEMAPAPEVSAAAPAVADVDRSGAAITYRVKGNVTVPADGDPHKVTVAVFELNPALDYVAAPKLVEAVYRRAKVVNESEYTLLPGPANLFAGEEFTGATRLELVAPQGEIELYLGPDDRVKVERELKRREVDKRIIGSRRRLHYAYEIALENLLPTEAKISLHDQIPVARHEEIKVRLESAEPKPSEQTELNELIWEFILGPGAKKTVRFDFGVEYPQTMEVVGMP